MDYGEISLKLLYHCGRLIKMGFIRPVRRKVDDWLITIFIRNVTLWCIISQNGLVSLTVSGLYEYRNTQNFDWALQTIDMMLEYTSHFQKLTQDPVEHLKWSFFAKIINYFSKKLHLRWSIRFSIRLWFSNLNWNTRKCIVKAPQNCI